MNLFIFHRDFRLQDNNALIALAKEEQDIHLCFIFTDEQIKTNDYFSKRSFQAMVFCLNELSKTVKINFLSAKNEVTAITNLIKAGNKINKIYTNQDYTPYALKRSEAMLKLAHEHHFIYREFADYLLFSPKLIKKQDRTFYQVFTPYWNEIRFHQQLPVISKTPKFNAKVLPSTIKLSQYQANDFGLPLTRKQAELAISQINKDYATLRNEIAVDTGTSHLSTAIKFGVVSIREVHHWAAKRFSHFDNPFSRQLMWRDFFYQATFNAYLSGQWNFGDNWFKKMNQMPWTNNQEHFQDWKDGKTGIPLVDAGMIELKTTGRMHNRVRLVCGSYLVKNLNIDWRWGEKYFAEQLIDYDPIVNQCSWQWVAGTGFDAQQYIRIFNPFIQQEKYDPKSQYINHFLNNREPIPEIIDYKASVNAAKERYQKLIK